MFTLYEPFNEGADFGRTSTVRASAAVTTSPQGGASNARMHLPERCSLLMRGESRTRPPTMKNAPPAVFAVRSTNTRLVRPGQEEK